MAEGNCRLCGWWERSLAGCEILPLEHATVNNVNTKEDYKRLEGQ